MQKDIHSDAAFEKDRFRVVVFGSARTKKGDPLYDEVFNLGKAVAEMGFDIVTGGGPGAMEAANMGHQAGKGDQHIHSFGLKIKLPFESVVNSGVEIEHDHERFSTRLDEFMSLADIVVVTPGGIGTLLEFFYTWQLIQVKHVCKMPIILVEDMWHGLITWLEEVPMGNGMFDKKDMQFVKFAKNCDEAKVAIEEWHQLFEDLGPDACMNWKKYKFK